jgi:glycyl-tRNA synthetase
MEFIYNFNALPFLNKRDLMLKDYLVKRMEFEIQELLFSQNKSWQFVQIEAPCLIPRELVNANYTDEDIWVQEQHNHDAIVLKPETTASSYLYMEHLLKSQHYMPPLCVWQTSKSFRREQDQVTKHCRYKEFYQQEFQCLYTKDTKNNYQESIIEPLAKIFLDVVALPTRIVLSDRLPDYSLKTIDIEVFNNDKWMEVCSVSLRKDFTYQPMVKNQPRDCFVLEIAFGLERLIYNINQRQTVFKALTVTNEL